MSESPPPPPPSRPAMGVFCPICTTTPRSIPSATVLACQHTFCLLCIRAWIRTQHATLTEPRCPLCQRALQALQVGTRPVHYVPPKVGLRFFFENLMGVLTALDHEVDHVIDDEEEGEGEGEEEDVFAVLDARDLLVAKEVGVKSRLEQGETWFRAWLPPLEAEAQGVLEGMARLADRSGCSSVRRAAGMVREEEEWDDGDV